MTDLSPDDPLPAIRAEVDQLLANAPLYAEAIKGLYNTYTDQGFTEKQALYLAVTHVKGPGPPP